MDGLKRQAAAQALEHVQDGMKLGLGTGSTAKHFVDLLGQRVAGGLRVVGVPTSEATRAQAEACKIPLTTLDAIDRLDLTVDGADELDGALNLIKGGGGALLREKIVAAASDRMIVIADDTKWVDVLGRFPLPVEVIPLGWPPPSGPWPRHLPKAAFPGKWGPQGQGRPRFCHRWRPLDCRCPSRAHHGCAASGGPVEPDPGCRRTRVVHWPGQHRRPGRCPGNSRS
jgi:hypothetical protein